MMQLSAHGRLGQDPRVVDTKSGKLMTVASIAVDLPTRSEGETHTLWLGIVGFGRLADLLAKHAKGETLSVCGRAQHNTFTDRDGTAREQLQVIADTIVSARSARPSGGKRKAAASDAAPAAAASSSEESAPAFDDEIPF